MTTRPRPAKILGAATVFVLLAMLLLRFSIYRHMYIAPDAPYRISDVIEFVMGCALALSFVISVVGAIVLPLIGLRENRIAGGWLLITCGVVFWSCEATSPFSCPVRSVMGTLANISIENGSRLRLPFI